MATKEEIRDRAANDLGLLRLGQSLQSQDDVRISAAYDEVHAKLVKDGLAVWASTGDCPAELVPHVVSLVCLNCMNTYPVSTERSQRILLMSGPNGEIARREISKLVTPDYPSQSEPTDF